MAKRNRNSTDPSSLEDLNDLSELDADEAELDEFAEDFGEPGPRTRAAAAGERSSDELDEFDESDDLEDFEESRLTGRQKLWVGLCAAVSFVVFLVIFFPLNEILRYQLGNFSKQIQADFVDLDLNLLGPDTVDGLSVQLPNNGPRFTAGRIESELGWLNLLGAAPDGIVRMFTAEFSMPSMAFEANEIQLDMDIADVRKSLAVWNGRLDLQARGVRLDRLPLDSLPIPIALDELKIARINLKLLFEEGAVSFNDAELISDLFRVTMNGSGRMGRNIGATTLNARLCLKPVANLENKNPELFTIYIMGGGSAGGELCANISGSLAAPQVQVERSANSFSGFPGPDDANADTDAAQDQDDAPAEEEGESGGTDV